MAKTFRAWEPEQRWLLPPAIEEFVPPGHLAHFVRELVREELDLSGIVEVYDEERGQPPYRAAPGPGAYTLSSRWRTSSRGSPGPCWRTRRFCRPTSRPNTFAQTVTPSR